MRDLVPGDQLDPFELTDLLARSGMASIFKAVDTRTGRVVALKVPHVQLESDVVFYERFQREEKLGQRVHHPNVVEVLPADFEKSRMYMAMEYVEGTSLRALLDGKHPLPTTKALDIARQVCEALVYLHAQGIIHRDIKPENILITAAGQVKILDFGIALVDSSRRLTWAGFSTTLGTPDYMAPEQIRGRRGDARTDVYALGTLLYEMLTCHVPFATPNARAMLNAKRNEEPRSPRYYVPDLDPALEAIILTAIARTPRDRYASAGAMLTDLRDPAAAALRLASEGEASEGAAAALRRGGRQGHDARRRVALIAVIASLLAGLAALVWLTHRQSTTTTAPQGPSPSPSQREPPTTVRER